MFLDNINQNSTLIYFSGLCSSQFQKETRPRSNLAWKIGIYHWFVRWSSIKQGDYMQHHYQINVIILYKLFQEVRTIHGGQGWVKREGKTNLCIENTNISQTNISPNIAKTNISPDIAKTMKDTCSCHRTFPLTKNN